MNPDDVTGSPRLAGQVRRYHTWPTLQVQTNAEHSWQVARIYEALFGPPSAVVEQRIRWHDAGEIVTGDLPFPVKSKNPDIKVVFDEMERLAVVGLGVELAAVTDEERHRMKLCDLVEMWEFGMVELALGNRFAQPIVDRTYEAFMRLLVKEFKESGVTERVGAHMERVRRWTR